MQTNEKTTLQTTIRTYRYDVSKPEDAGAYDALCARMAAQGAKCFESRGQGSHYEPEREGLTIQLETAFIFENQWNTAPVDGVTDKGLRVFDWAQDYLDNRDIKQGHYLDLTPEMTEARGNRLKCGYCGKQYDRRDNPPQFCNACLGSEYLKPEDLKLTRVEPVTHQTFAPLTAEETADLMPRYQAEQAGKGSERSRIAREKFSKRLQAKRDETVSKAEAEFTGFYWLFNRGCSVRLMENCIYYSHKTMFTFGWRDKLEAGADLDWLLENLSEAPFEYSIVTAHRGTLGGRE